MGEGCGDSKEFAFCERFTLASPLMKTISPNKSFMIHARTIRETMLSWNTGWNSRDTIVGTLRTLCKPTPLSIVMIVVIMRRDLEVL